MARQRNNSCRLCRRAGEKLFLKGDRCLGPKCAFTRRPVAPGMHGAGRRRRVSDYGLQLREKQKAKAMYGVLERQFRRYYDEASRTSNTGFALLNILEHRLDSIIYRAGWTHSRSQARQLSNHGHIAVNGKKVGTPSYTCKAGDVITALDAPKDMKAEGATIPAWLTVDEKKIVVNALETREAIDVSLNEQLIVEYYSR